MRQAIFVGIGAGLAAALLFVAPLGGSSLALPLFLLTGLPIALAGLGWGLLAGALAALVGAGLAFAMLSGLAAVMFLALFGAPTLWVVRLAGLSRHTGPNEGDREWYPLSRILLHAALAVALGIAVAGFVAGYDPDALAAEASAALADLFAASPGTDAPTAAELQPAMRAYTTVLPFVGAVVLTMVTVFNVAIGARIVRASGRLARPAEPLWRATVTREVLAGFAVALALAFFLPEVPARLAQLVAGALFGALALGGLAVVHAATLGTAARGGLLAATYTLTLISGIPLLLLAVAGAADYFLDLRSRLSRRGPPSP